MISEAEFQRKVTEAQERLETLYLETDGKCYISFSGGKDSTILLALAKQCAEMGTLPREGIKAVYINTGIELGVTVDFVKWCKDNWYQNIEIIRPDVSFDWIVKNKGKPFLSKIKANSLGRWQRGMRSENLLRNFVGIGNSKYYTRSTKIGDCYFHMLHPNFSIKSTSVCCNYLKKKPGEKYAKENGIKGYAVGTRNAEGGARNYIAQLRATRKKGICTTIQPNGLIQKMPIIEWSEEEAEQFISRYNVPISRAYSEFGFDRTGCMACPFSKKLPHDLSYLFHHEPNRYKAIMHWLKDVYIAQNVILPFDEAYERERVKKWNEEYEPMRQEMLRKYRPESSLIKDNWQTYLEL